MAWGKKIFYRIKSVMAEKGKENLELAEELKVNQAIVSKRYVMKFNQP